MNRCNAKWALFFFILYIIESYNSFFISSSFSHSCYYVLYISQIYYMSIALSFTLCCSSLRSLSYLFIYSNSMHITAIFVFMKFMIFIRFYTELADRIMSTVITKWKCLALCGYMLCSYNCMLCVFGW